MKCEKNFIYINNLAGGFLQAIKPLNKRKSQAKGAVYY